MPNAGRTVWGVWIGKYEPELHKLFSTEAAARVCADAYNAKNVAEMNAYFVEEAAKYGYLPVKTWEPQAFVQSHEVHDA